MEEEILPTLATIRLSRTWGTRRSAVQGLVESGGDSGSALAEALGVFVALEPAVDHALGCSHLLHVEDSFDAGVGFAAVVDEFVEVFVDGRHGLSLNS